MENLDLNIFNSLKELSLNNDDINDAFIEYISRNDTIDKSYIYKKRLFKNFIFLNEFLFDDFWAFNEFSELINITTKESVFLATLAISLDNNIDDEQFLNICNSINFHNEKKELIDNLFTKISIPKSNFLIFKKEVFIFFNSFEEHVFSSIISKNKEFCNLIENNVYSNRKEVFINFLNK